MKPSILKHHDEFMDQIQISISRKLFTIFNERDANLLFLLAMPPPEKQIQFSDWSGNTRLPLV